MVGTTKHTQATPSRVAFEWGKKRGQLYFFTSQQPIKIRQCRTDIGMEESAMIFITFDFFPGKIQTVLLEALFWRKRLGHGEKFDSDWGHSQADIRPLISWAEGRPS